MAWNASVTLWDRFFGFEADPSDTFRNFSPLHVASLVACVVGIALALLLASRLREKPRRRCEIVLASTMIFCQIVQMVWHGLSGHFDPGTDLIVFHMCGVFNIVAIVLLFQRTRSPFFQDALYFAGLPGALMAVATPDLEFGFPHFMWVIFFLTHAMLAFVPLHFLVIRSFRPRPRSIPKIFLFLNLVLIPVYAIDRLTNGNYFYLLRPPRNTLAEVFADWVGWGWYLVPMELAALLLFGLLALPWIRWHRKPGDPKGMDPKGGSDCPDNGCGV
jgi:hypothetical integral membrane protein (TIGR02206 family)